MHTAIAYLVYACTAYLVHTGINTVTTYLVHAYINSLSDACIHVLRGGGDIHYTYREEAVGYMYQEKRGYTRTKFSVQSLRRGFVEARRNVRQANDNEGWGCVLVVEDFGG